MKAVLSVVLLGFLLASCGLKGDVYPEGGDPKGYKESFVNNPTPRH